MAAPPQGGRTRPIPAPIQSPVQSPTVSPQKPQKIEASSPNAVAQGRPSVLAGVLSRSAGAPVWVSAPPAVATPSARGIPGAEVRNQFGMLACPPAASSPSARGVAAPVQAGSFQHVTCPAPQDSPSATRVAYVPQTHGSLAQINCPLPVQSPSARLLPQGQQPASGSVYAFFRRG
eukprot:TRINITY_DN54687_c0_g1_i1.p1 TRINITY_DN54687_c0_g1~~TRINITY_DN54687_c0_g1_i1.p1  ORF type:complete len:176 (-),score=23.36 TRINITY_DN54687_c0_g1_i1:82-609(-)